MNYRIAILSGSADKPILSIFYSSQVRRIRNEMKWVDDSNS